MRSGDSSAAPAHPGAAASGASQDLPPTAAGPRLLSASDARRLRRRRRWRLFRRGLIAVALLLALLACVCFYGWRHGFTPLPDPVAGGEWTGPGLVLNDGLTASNYWHWMREAGRPGGPSLRQNMVHAASLTEWAPTGYLPATNRVALGRFFNDHPAVAVDYQNALAATDYTPERSHAANARQAQTGLGRLLPYAAWRAGVDEADGRTAEALRHLLDGLRLALAPGPLSPARSQASELVQAWRRIALEGPSLDPEAGRRLLVDVADVIAILPPPEVTVSRAAALAGAVRDRWPTQARRGRDDPGALFRQAFAGMARDLIQGLAELTDRLVGDRRRPARGSGQRGIRRLAEPSVALLLELQRRAARPEDVVRIREAYLSRVRAALRRGDEAQALADGAALQNAYDGRSLAGRWFDRPAVWRSLRDCGNLKYFVEEAQRAHAALESCRLTLALRLYRDQHGAWPDRIEAMCPEWLSAIPVDPYSGKPFLYEREGNGWLVRAATEEAAAPEPAEEGILFHSSEPAEARMLRLLSGQATTVSGVLDPQLLIRYGLLPGGIPPPARLELLKRYGLAPSDLSVSQFFQQQTQSNAALARLFSNLLPGVSDLRDLIRLGEAANRATRSAQVGEPATPAKPQPAP